MSAQRNEAEELIETQPTAPARLEMPPIPDFLDRRKPFNAGDNATAHFEPRHQPCNELASIEGAAAAVAPISDVASLPGLIDRAAQAIASAKSHAEVLNARETAAFAYDAAKRAVRLEEATRARAHLVEKMLRVQAYALEVETQANCRLADEYDAAQEQGQIARRGETLRRGPEIPNGNFGKPTTKDIGLSPKAIHEARRIRDAEAKDPGIVHRVLEERIARGEEPTRAAVRRAVAEALGSTARVHGSSESRRDDTRDAVRKLLKGCGLILDSAGDCDAKRLTEADMSRIQAARDALTRLAPAGKLGQGLALGDTLESYG
jgi:hypothetical protein